MDTETDITYTQDEARRLDREVKRLSVEAELMRAEIRLLRAKRFGASSERTELSGQGVLFNEAESHACLSTAEPTTEEVLTRRRTRKAGKREADLTGLPVRRIDYELAEDERVCPECGGDMHEMGTEVRREVEYVPASYTVIEHATHVYACRRCQKDAESTPIIQAKSPRPLFLGSLASASLLSQILADKYLYHLPLYRQEAAFACDGLALSRQTLANWTVRASEVWLFGIYDRMKEKLVCQDVIHADETTLQVLREPGRKASQKSYMWLYRSGHTAAYPIVLYEYQKSRSHEHPRAFLKDFSGYCHADGYAGYHRLPGRIAIVGCWAHARRRFDEALVGMPEDRRAGSLAGRGLVLINRLFELERTFATMGPEQRHAERMSKSLPVIEALYAWADSAGALPKSAVGKAIHYLKEQKPYLMRVLEDGRLELSNNRAERSIKPFVIGRKNWLFSNTPQGAEASSVIFSIIETAKENHLNVYRYLKYLFEQLPNATSSDLDRLLPWSDALPSDVKVPMAI
jgi:transposase